MPQGNKAGDATLPRKASKEIVWYPYRKPTGRLFTQGAGTGAQALTL